MPTTAVEPTEEIDWSRVDRKIVSSFGRKSVKELAKETNIPQEVLLQRKQELVDSVDALTIQMQKHQLMANLHEISQKAQEDYENSPWETKSGLLNSAVAAVKELLKQLNLLESRGTAEVESLNKMRLRELLSLVDRVVYSGISEAAERYDIPERELQDIFFSRLTTEAALVENG